MSCHSSPRGVSMRHAFEKDLVLAHYLHPFSVAYGGGIDKKQFGPKSYWRDWSGYKLFDILLSLKRQELVEFSIRKWIKKYLRPLTSCINFLIAIAFYELYFTWSWVDLERIAWFGRGCLSDPLASNLATPLKPTRDPRGPESLTLMRLIIINLLWKKMNAWF